MATWKSRSIVAMLPAVLLVSSSAFGCDSTGAFGLEFGGKPAKGAKKVRGNDATITYMVVPPKPDARFDEYSVRVDSESGEIYEVMATKKITPYPPKDGPGLSKAEQERAEQNVQAFAREYASTLSPEVQSVLIDEYGTGSRQGMLNDTIHMYIIASLLWEVSVACKDVKREGIILERVL